MSATPKEEVHRLVDELPEHQMATARLLLEALRPLAPATTGVTTAEAADLAQATAELTRRMGPGLVPGSAFMTAHRIDLDALIEQQGVRPVTNFDDLLGDFWPADETADEFMAAVRPWRGTPKHG